jgi:hypothetical protein
MFTKLVKLAVRSHSTTFANDHIISSFPNNGVPISVASNLEASNEDGADKAEE